ncbi:MAG: hypothetical protein HDT38_05420 [Clostridiales bacterium]|nr:hypothetical protein [Clostridiales bacterium]
MKELLMALPAGRETGGRAFGLTPAHMAYRVGPGPRLLGIQLPPGLRGGLMQVDCAGFDGAGDPVGCCRQILGEVRRRSFRGIVCDFEGMPSGCLGKMVEILDRNCAAQGWTLYVPESYAPQAPQARVLIPSALTHGTLERRLREAAERYGAGRTTLAVEWVREDFPLPARGRGEPIPRETLEEMLRRLEPAVFFDKGLCAHYFTYMKGPQAHFVLFDTPRSIREKLEAAKRLGIAAALLPQPEIEPHFDEIFGANT